jgi:ADP-heptose:LPS heptosyltransferase
MIAKQIPKEVVDKFVLRHPEYDFVSLQIGEGFLDSFKWVDTADKIQTLDAVISVDSAIAHCAASVGVKTLNLIGDESMACWRWYPVAEKTYWYDNMTTVWWDNYSDWDTGLEKAVSYLPQVVSKKRSKPKKSVV